MTGSQSRLANQCRRSPMLDKPTKLREFKTYIDGKWVEAASGKRLESGRAHV